MNKRITRIIFCVITSLTFVSCNSSQANTNSVLLQLPKVRQATSYTCGPAALMSILRYYGAPPQGTQEDTLATELGSAPEVGTDYRAIEAYATANGYTVEGGVGLSFDELKAFLDAGKPVFCAIQAWYGETPADWADIWNSGHYVVAVGYDSSRVIFMDPWTLGNYTYIPNDEFLARWHDLDADYVTKLSHLGIAISKPAPDYDPDEILKLE